VSEPAHVTHVEVRRVQNGFIVLAVDYSEDFRQFQHSGVRASFVAKDEEEVKTVIGNILASAELKWLPTMDMPMVVAMKRGITKSPYEHNQESQGQMGVNAANIASGLNPARP
jgi:hypothetical protein